jgi:predicted negative regulator of RcsB-dependent stress response
VDDLSEKEQIEQMRAWWSEYGNYVIGGIVVGVALLVGMAQYRASTERAQTEASVLYESVFKAVTDGDADEAEVAAIDLYQNYESTVYPAQARLAMARLYMDKGRDQDAADTLQALVDAEPESELGLIARLRLAKVLLYQDKAQDVVDLLSETTDTAFVARFSEALGDAYVVLGQYADARDAYFVAMADNAAMPTVDRVLVQMKVDDLPEIAPPDDAAEEPAEDPAEEPAEEAADDAAGEALEPAIDGDEAPE